MVCNNCPRKCGVDRSKTVGYCKATNNIKVALSSVHYGEEPCISGKNGSGTIFFSGCNLRCVYCQNYNISHNNFGKEISSQRLAEIFKELEQKGVHNINLVTPTHFIDGIIDALNIYKPKIPICYNTSGYESVDSIKRLKNYVDIFLVDLKYYDNEIASKYSSCKDYFEKATSAIKQMLKNIPNNIYNDDGIMQKGVIIRHLVLPGLLNDSMKIIDWVSKFAKTAIFSLMSQYTPCGSLQNFTELQKTVHKIEYKLLVNYIKKLNLSGFVQDFTSASNSFIPNFNLDGV